MAGSVRVGTSGWEYAHWRGSFYPQDLPKNEWLEYFVRRFDTVELNATFYRLPSAQTFAGWNRRVPNRFRFAVKASRYLTHIRRLREPEEPLERLFGRARRLGRSFGPVLYQLPPNWRPNEERLGSFLETLPRHPQAVEFRDRRWYVSSVLSMLDDAGVGLCLHDMAGSAPDPRPPVAPIAYVRFHGSGERYGGSYPSQRLTAWARRMAEWADGGCEVWAFFNNDIGGHAPRDADRLREMLARRGH